MNPSKNISIGERRSFWIKMLSVIATVAFFCVALMATAFAQGDSDSDGGGGGNRSVGAVFVGTNHNNTMDASQPPNQVVMFLRAANGRLTRIGYFDTGGQGSGPSKRFAGDGLGSSHSVQLSQDKNFLFVTNAGSDNVSVFRVRRFGLQLTDIQSTTAGGGRNRRFPNSVTQHGDLVYVLNSSNEGSITGFRFDDRRGRLTPIPNSTRRLSANQSHPPDTLFNPTQVQFTPDGSKLVVTIKDGPAAGVLPGIIPTGPGRVLVFDVRNNGRPSEDFTQNNLDGAGPFGFSFDRNGNLLLTLFVGGDLLPNPFGDVGPASAVASFRIRENGTLREISRVKIDQFDTCWIESANGQFAFAPNYTSGTVGSFRIRNNGRLEVVDATAGFSDDLPLGRGNRQGATNLDIRVSPDARFVYNVLPGSGAVAGWRINGNGTITKIGEFSLGGFLKTINGDSAPEERFGPGGSPAGIEVL